MSVAEKNALDTPVLLCQSEVEFQAVLEMYKMFAPKRVLEIGTASGGTLYWWLKHAQPGAIVVTVDLEEPAYESNEHLYDEWTPESVGVVQVRGNSHDPEVVEACAEFGPFDWLFIDGSHVYEDAVQDWENYSALCTPGGAVLFHDIALDVEYDDGREAGVDRLWRGLQALGYWTREFRTHTNAYGIGLLRLP